MDILEDYFRAFHGQFIDNLGYSFLITRDWVGTKDNGIKRIDIQTKTYKDILPQQKKSPLYTRNIIRMTKEKVWIGTFNGIYLYDIQNDTIMSIQQNKSDLYSLSSNAIKELYKDQEGGIWVCTDNGVSATLLLIQNSKGTIIFLDKERSMEILYTIFA